MPEHIKLIIYLISSIYIIGFMYFWKMVSTRTKTYLYLILLTNALLSYFFIPFYSISFLAFYFFIEWFFINNALRSNLLATFSLISQVFGILTSITITFDSAHFLYPHLFNQPTAPYYFVVLLVAQLSILTLYLYFVRFIIKKYKLLDITTLKYKQTNFLGASFLTVSLIVSLVLLHGYSFMHRRVYLGFYSLLLLGIIGVGFGLLIYSINRAEEQDKQVTILTNYYLKEKQKAEVTEGFKHDYQTLLTNVKICLDLGEYQEAKKFFEEVVKESDSILHSQNRYNQLLVLGNIPLQGLLLEADSKCQKAGIELILQLIPIPKTIKISNFDLIRMLSILLNNAIEEVKNHSEKEKRINLNMYKENQQLVFEIINPVSQKVDTKQILATGYTTKKGHRGIGLSNVIKITQKNKAVFFSITTIDNTFKTTVRVSI